MEENLQVPLLSRSLKTCASAQLYRFRYLQRSRIAFLCCPGKELIPGGMLFFHGFAQPLHVSMLYAIIRVLGTV